MSRYALYKIPWNFLTEKGKPQGFNIKIFDEAEHPPSLKELQAIVGGLIQEVSVGAEWQEILEDRVNQFANPQSSHDIAEYQFDGMYVNEEGRFMDLPFNTTASAITDQFIVGDVAVVFVRDRSPFARRYSMR